MNFFLGYKNRFEIITSSLNKDAGFYSQLFFLLNHYIYCRENKKNFKIDSEKWFYKSKNGWTDYFKPIELKYYNSNHKKYYQHGNIIKNYSIEYYKYAISEIYLYNDDVVNNIKNTKEKFKLLNYDSIYIRRGDKLINETIISQESIYIKLLLEKNPNCKTIFLQTDDYNCFINLQKYIHDNNLNIELITICNKNSVGSITSNVYKKYINHAYYKNKEYISKIQDELLQTKTIEDMNNDEIYQHTLELLTGVDLCINSNICVCDFTSNVSRFIKLAHKNTHNVFDINNTIVDFSKKTCPAGEF